MSAERFETRATVWLWTTDKAPASWHFITIEGEAAEGIHATVLMDRLENGRRRGWGSVKVTAQIGDSIWATSLFPHKDSRGWLLPVKASVRKAEKIVVGDMVDIAISI